VIPVQQAKRARSVLRRALRQMGTDTSTLALRWVVATPECRLEAPGAPVLDADRLLGCWNVVLARWLRAAVRQELEAVGSPAAAEVTADPTGRVVVSHLVDLARHGDPPAPGDDEGTWYLETLPSVLTRA
jgi:hypothetical protein